MVDPQGELETPQLQDFPSFWLVIDIVYIYIYIDI